MKVSWKVRSPVEFLLLLIVWPASAALADGAKIGGIRCEGVVVRCDARGMVLLLDDGQTRRLRPDEARGATLDLPTTGRWAHVRAKDGAVKLVRVTGWDGYSLTASSQGTAARQLATTDTSRVVLYPVLASNRLMKVAHVAPKPDYCGEASIEMATTFLGKRVSQDQVNEVAGLNGSRGVYFGELEKALVDLKVRTLTPTAHAYRTPDDFDADLVRLIRLVDVGRPVLIGIWSDPDAKQNADQWACDHFVLLIGYDLERSILFVRDPNMERVREIDFERFQNHRENKFGRVLDVPFRLYRSWRLTDGTNVDGECVGVQDGHVRLRPESGNDKVVEMTALVPEDRQFLAALTPLNADRHSSHRLP